MPSMANITVKNVANADVVYVAKVPSAGDRSPAKWSQDAAHAVPAFRPAIAVGTKDSSDGRRRVAEINYVFPVIQAINGVDTLVDKLVFQGTLSGSKFTIDTATAEGVHQLSNLLASTLMRSQLSEGYAAT